MEKKLKLLKTGALGRFGELFLQKQDEGTKKGAVKGGLKKFVLPFGALLLSFAVSGTELALGVFPFGVALSCAASSFAVAAAVAAGAAASLATVGEGVLAPVAVTVTVFSFRVLRALWSGSRSGKEGTGASMGAVERIASGFEMKDAGKMKLSLAAALVLGVLNALGGINFWYYVFAGAFGAVMIPMLCFALSSLGRRNARPVMKKLGVSVLSFAAVLAVADVTVLGMNIGIIIALCGTFYIAWAEGIEFAALFGIVTGLALPETLSALCPIGGVVAAALFPVSSGAALIGGAAVSVSWALHALGLAAISEVMPEILFSSLLFYPAISFGILPEKIKFFSVPDTAGWEPQVKGGVFESTGDRLRRISGALSYMSHIFGNLSKRLRIPSNSECMTICLSAFEDACVTCGKKKLCHGMEAAGGRRAASVLAEKLRQNGRITVSSVPEALQRGCPAIDDVISDINREYGKAFKEGVKCDKTAVAAEDYGNFAALIGECVAVCEKENEKNELLTCRFEKKLDSLGVSFEGVGVYGERRPRIFVRGFSANDLTYGAEDLRASAEETFKVPLTEPCMSMDIDKLNMFMEARQRFSVKNGKYSSRGDRSEANGDAVASFEGPDGDYYFLIADGMGSGREAALTARIAAVFLERMLSAGCTPETALVLLNDFTRERRIECSSTVDLLRIDLFTGKAVFIKSGAAPSFVLRDGKLFKLECGTMPMGILKELSARSVEFDLEDGDTVIMISDGIMAEDRPPMWLYDLICDGETEREPPFELAKKIAAESKKHAFRRDDATAGVLRIEKTA